MIRNAIKRNLNSLLSIWNFELVRKQENHTPQSNFHHSMPSCEQRLKHAKSIGFNPKQIVDGGAYIGSWTRMVSSIFPEAKFLVIEPNPHLTVEIEATLSGLNTCTEVVSKALADEPGTLALNIWGNPKDATSASLKNHVKGSPGNIAIVEVDTIDNLLQEHHLRPELVKLDLQGAEFLALSGAENTLRTTEMFVVEFGCLEAYIDRTTPQQLMNIFYDNDYCLYDLVDCHYRPYDGALTGGDFFFVKNHSQLRKHKGWD